MTKSTKRINNKESRFRRWLLSDFRYHRDSTIDHLMVVLFFVIFQTCCHSSRLMMISCIVASVAVLAVVAYRWSHLAPITRWRRAVVYAATLAIVWLVLPVWFRFDEDVTDADMADMWFFEAFATIMLLLFGYSIYRLRKVRREARDEVLAMQLRARRRKASDLY